MSIGIFIFILSVGVFAARIRGNTQPIFPYQDALSQSRQGALLGFGLVVVGVVLAHLQDLIDQIRRHLASRR